MSDSSAIHALAGAFGGCASLAITYPLYARMIRQQIQQNAPAALSEDEEAGSASAVTHLRRLLSREGLAPHFHGLSAALWAIGVQSGAYYYCFQAFKNFHGVTNSPLGNVLTGAEAGIATVLLTNPLWVINSRQITRKDVRSPQQLPPPPSQVEAASSSDAQAAAASSEPLPSARSSLSTRTARAASLNTLGMLAAPQPAEARAGELDADSSARARAGASPDPALASPFPAHSSHSASSAPALPAPTVAASAPTAAGDESESLSEVSFFRALKLLVQREGLGGVYSGVGPALALVSSPALQFASYEWMRTQLLRHRTRVAVRTAALVSSAMSVAVGESASAAVRSSVPVAVAVVPELGNLDLFLLGAVSKILATLATYPIQTVKARLQRDGSPYSSMGLWDGIVACMRDTLAHGGMASFYSGLSAKIVQTALTSAFLFVIRERMLSWLVWLLRPSAVRKAAVLVVA